MSGRITPPPWPGALDIAAFPRPVDEPRKVQMQRGGWLRSRWEDIYPDGANPEDWPHPLLFRSTQEAVDMLRAENVPGVYRVVGYNTGAEYKQVRI